MLHILCHLWLVCRCAATLVSTLASNVRPCETDKFSQHVPVHCCAVIPACRTPLAIA